MPMNIREKISTSRLLTMIRGASSFREATAYHDVVQDPRFEDALYEQMTRKRLSAKEMIRRTGIERSYFYHILNGKKRPGRNMVIRIALCLRSSLQETNQLLRLAGISELYARRRWDAALIYAVTHQYTMEQANDLLITEGEEPLYQEEKHEQP